MKLWRKAEEMKDLRLPLQESKGEDKWPSFTAWPVEVKANPRARARAPVGSSADLLLRSGHVWSGFAVTKSSSSKVCLLIHSSAT